MYGIALNSDKINLGFATDVSILNRDISYIYRLVVPLSKNQGLALRTLSLQSFHC